MTRSTLSPRQRIIATLVAGGLSDKQIAGRLAIDEETVAYHIKRLSDLWNLDRSLNLRTQIVYRVIQGVD